MLKFPALLILLLCFSAGALRAQGSPYSNFVKEANAALEQKQYLKAAEAFSAAFQSANWKGYIEHRYAAARAWSMAGVPDSAFYNLFRITEKAGFNEYALLTSEGDFVPLQKDPRWADLLVKVKANMPAMPEVQQDLETIYSEDQKYRLMADSVEGKHGRQSKEMQALWNIIAEKDSLNLLKVSAILDKYGWLGPKEVGNLGNSALFLVIQHSDLPVQEKYLPMMRDAVKAGKAQGSSLALLEDRVLMRQGKKQIYGSQIRRDKLTGNYAIFPIDDPQHVDARRASVGLGPLAEYVKTWGLSWNAEEAEKMEKQPFVESKN